MSNTARQPLINRTGLTLGAVMLLAIVNMLSSYLTAESAENDSVRINLAGSLRMQSYRVAEALLIQNDQVLNSEDENLLQTRMEEFEQQLYRPVLSGHIQRGNYPELAKALAHLDSNWQTLKAQLNISNGPTPELLIQIDDFVSIINNFVSMLELQTENKFKLLRLLQGISLLVTIIIVVLGYVDISNNVVAPLRRLLTVANKIRGGDFSERLAVVSDNELSLLASTFNDMSQSLDTMYRELEEKVQEKTLHLEQARDGLALLYETSRLLSAEGSVVARIERSLVHMDTFFPKAKIIVDLTQNGTEAFRLSTPHLSEHHTSTYEYNFEIGRESLIYGELIIYPQQALSGEQISLLRAIADNIAAALNADWQQDRQHRLVLMEERAIIARELHDSLAQSLAYLKIQISRMQMLKSRGGEPDELEKTIQHIKSGIDAAYLQLRELLTTFRLQLSDEGLKSALEKTAEEFSKHSDISITLNYEIMNFPLTPNEEIHILQIVREAISNVVRHSNASSAEIIVVADRQRNIEVCINDNGSGFDAADSNVGHYGKVIMQERAKTLEGQVDFCNRREGGAQVRLTFVPEVAKKSLLSEGKSA